MGGSCLSIPLTQPSDMASAEVQTVWCLSSLIASQAPPMMLSASSIIVKTCNKICHSLDGRAAQKPDHKELQLIVKQKAK